MTKTSDEIFEEMKEVFTSETGISLNDGGDMALRLYALALQLESLWTQADYVQRQSFPQTADGEYLDYHAELRDLHRTEATYAQGEIRFYLDEVRTTDVTIAAETSVMTAGDIEFLTEEEAVIYAGDIYCDAKAVAVVAGSFGNVAKGTVRYMPHPPTGVSYCDNLAAFTDGSDDEDDESLRTRVLSTYESLPNGANIAYYETQCMEVDGVAAVSVLAKNRGIGTVDIIVATENGEASEELLAEIAEKLDSMREICVDIEVSAPTILSFDIEASIVLDGTVEEDETLTAIENSLRAYYNGERLGQDILIAEISNIIFTTSGVKNYKLLSPTADISVATDELYLIGDCSLEVGT